MHGKKFHFSEALAKKLVELTEGTIPSGLFDTILLQLEEETSKYHFTPFSESNLLRIFSSIYDPAFFLKEIVKFPHHGEILIAISASSNYLTDIVVRNPEYLYQIFDQSYLTKKLSYEEVKKEVDGTERFKSLNSKLNFLRQVKKRLTLKIGLTDILALDELISITEQLSFLAKSINANLFELCYRETLSRYNLSETAHKYSLCSLGKLGGNELNYSSDVDLILFYDSNNIVPGTGKEYHELLSEAANLFIKSSTDITDRGYIYRVDFRLRPDGKYSPLCKTLNDYAKYYETRGESWERQMLIKLNFIGGDEDLYNRFSRFIQPYVYPSSFSYSIKSRIKEMKQNIERHYSAQGNVKTFRGGIRDIEFAVQSLQLINGGKIKSIRTGNTLKAIELLANNKLLKKNERTSLTGAYLFYRRIEHFLQLMNDTQTHVISDNEELQNKLVIFLGMKSIEDFQRKLDDYRKKVRAVYASILSSDDSEKQIVFDLTIFKNKQKAERSLAYLRNGIGITGQREFDSRTVELFGILEPRLFKKLMKVPDPDRTLDNFVKVIRTTKFPSMWFNEFGENKFFDNFIDICSYSQKAVDIISSGGQYEELFLSRKVFIKQFEDLNEHSVTDIILFLSVQYALGLTSERRLSVILSEYISRKLSSVLESHNLSYNFFIAGLGSFGSMNMSFTSDIDLLIVADDVINSPDIQKDFQNFLATARKLLFPFEVDFKLRPEGKKSPLVWDLRNYTEYLHNRARVWEFQSLLKLNFVYGDKKLFSEFKNTIHDCLKGLDSQSASEEILKMYSTIQKQSVRVEGGGFNIKLDRGGLLTIDFILQKFCLTNTRIGKKCSGMNFYSLYSSLKRDIDSNHLTALKDNFIFLRRTELAIQNIFNSSKARLSSSADDRVVLARFLKFKNAEEFGKNFSDTIKLNNGLYEKYVGK